MGGNKYFFSMVVMSILFFMVGFITTMNNSLINFLSSSKWMLSFTEKQLINTSFFGAYLFSVPLSFLLHKLGYKSSAVLSLFIITLGFVMVFPSVSIGYWAFLCSMFVVAVGIALLQIVLNPYVLALGDECKAASRLNLTGFFNSLATVIAPLFVSFFISTDNPIAGASDIMERPDPQNVRIPFLFIAGIAFMLGFILFRLKLPEIADNTNDDDTSKNSPYKYPYLIFGSIAIFMYMGIEVGIPSFLPDWMKSQGINSINIMGIDLNSTTILSIYWGGLMVGRLIGAIVLQNISARVATTFCSSLAVVLLLSALSAGGKISLLLLALCGFCNSILWGNIFNLSTEGLGRHTKLASGIVCTFAIGGALLPPLMGYIQQIFGAGDLFAGTRMALSCLLVFYSYIILFALILSKVGKTIH